MLSDQDVSQAIRELVELNRRTSELLTLFLARTGHPGSGAEPSRRTVGARPSSSRPAGLRRRPRLARARRGSHTAAARIRELLGRSPDRVWHLRDVERELPDVAEQTVRATMGRLARKGELVGFRNGYFQLRRR